MDHPVPLSLHDAIVCLEARLGDDAFMVHDLLSAVILDVRACVACGVGPLSYEDQVRVFYCVDDVLCEHLGVIGL